LDELLPVFNLGRSSGMLDLEKVRKMFGKTHEKVWNLFSKLCRNPVLNIGEYTK